MIKYEEDHSHAHREYWNQILAEVREEMKNEVEKIAGHSQEEDINNG